MSSVDPNDLRPETACPKGTEDIHCNCWYDGDKCHFCDDPAKDNGVI